MNAAGLKRELLSKVEQNKHATCGKQQRLDVSSPFSNVILPWSMKGNRLQFYGIVSIRSLRLFHLFFISNGVAEL